jgi:hypothetical protein
MVRHTGSLLKDKIEKHQNIFKMQMHAMNLFVENHKLNEHKTLLASPKEINEVVLSFFLYFHLLLLFLAGYQVCCILLRGFYIYIQF